MALGNLASLIFYPLGGYIADYQGRIKLIGYMTFGYGAAFLIHALQSLFADMTPRERRGRVMASIGSGASGS
jgi:MFS family permease